MDLSNWLVVIPARLKSTRLPEKPLCLLAGKPLIIRTYENLLPLSQKGAEIIVATDSEKISKVCTENFIPVMLTDEANSGTDRVFQVALKKDRPFILNVQGDEPFVKLADLIELMKSLEEDPLASLGSLYFRSTHQDEFLNPNNVKVVLDTKKYALYFSRHSIPYLKNEPQDFYFYHHIGVYAFRKKCLMDFCQLKPSSLEKLENLEQLRAIENGMKIKMVEASEKSVGIDTFEDLEKAQEYCL